MSFSHVLPYFRDHLSQVGYDEEHEDGFNFENIGSTILHNSYHLELGTFSGGEVGQGCQEVDIPTTIRIFRRGYRKPWEARDAALTDMQSVVEELSKHQNAVHDQSVKVVTFESLDMVPIDDSNDNSFIVVLGFTAKVVIGLR